MPSQQTTVSGDDVAADSSADVADDVIMPSQQMTVVALMWLLMWRMTSALTQPVTRPGQRSTGSTVKPDPVNTTQALLPRAATHPHTRRTFWWRVRARERVFLGNFGTYRFVSKFPTMWYIDLACLKLLQI